MKKHLFFVCIVMFVFVLVNTAKTTGTINVIAPNGGENWKKGRSYDIKWSSRNVIGTVKIVLMKGLRRVKVIHEFESTKRIVLAGKYAWRIPMNLRKGSNYKVRFVSSGDKGRKLGESDNKFTISDLTVLTTVRTELPPVIGIISPDGREKVLKTNPYAIMWTASKSIGKPTIIIKKGGIPVETYPSVTPVGPFGGNKYKWTWNIPARIALGDDYKVKIVAESGSPTDESSRNFSIVDKQILVTIPRAGSVWERRSRQIIRFRCTNITQNLRVWVKGYPSYPIAENVRPDEFEVVWPRAGIVAEIVSLPAVNHIIIVETMDRTVQGESHPVFIPE